MDQGEQIQRFAEEIDSLVERFREEYDMTYAGLIGVLQMKIHLLCAEASELNEGPEYPPERNE